MFSSRLPSRLEANALAQAMASNRRARRPLADLTITNPTAAGISYPALMFARLAAGEVAQYVPRPFGLETARQAVSADYARRGILVPPDRILLTASTSEAYSLLFKLLCAPCGDSVLVPAPSYPLFEHLTALDGVAAHTYRLEYDGRWWLDLASADEIWDASTRAVLAVSPNNPTGSFLTTAELAALDTRCAARGAALIVDEVFADYPLSDSAGPSADGEAAVQALTFRLGGLSKSAALPQIKLGWIALDGPAALVAAAMERLELICDTYLSVSTPAQVAAPDLIALGASPRKQILKRVRFNYAELRQAAANHPSVEVLQADGGWSAVLRIPARGPEEQFVLDLLDRDGIIVHPGFFFDFPREAYIVVSLLTEPAIFRPAIARVLERADG
jgi:aspartate/methionine/tyrosine aminotransferase